MVKTYLIFYGDLSPLNYNVKAYWHNKPESAIINIANPVKVALYDCGIIYCIME